MPTAALGALTDQPVVLRVRSDPEPMHATEHGHAQRPVVQPHTNTVEATIGDSLEVQRRVRRLKFELCVVPPGQGLNLGGQRVQALPEALRCGVLQSSRTDPARWSASASAASASSFPESASWAICRSHAAASNSANQWRNSASSAAGKASTAFSIDFTFPMLSIRSASNGSKYATSEYVEGSGTPSDGRRARPRRPARHALGPVAPAPLGGIQRRIRALQQGVGGVARADARDPGTDGHGVFADLPKQVVLQSRNVEISAGFAGLGAVLVAVGALLSLRWNRTP